MKGVFSLLIVLFSFAVNAQGVAASTGSLVKQADAEASLHFHNKVRKEVGVGPLKWSPSLAAFAQAWADHLASTGCTIKHRPQSGRWAQQYGENIYFATAPNITTLDASKAWYDEIKDYNYEKLTVNNIARVGHYTQMVWRATTEEGFGVAKCPSGATIIVANYSPKGNYLGGKPY